MTNDEKLKKMKMQKVYPALINKAVRKNRSVEEVYEVTSWLTGYSVQDIEKCLDNSDLSYGEFFVNMPHPNANRDLVKGSICGVKIDEIQDPIIKDIRRLDKLVDELARGKSIDKILHR